MPETVILAIIGGVVTILTAIIGKLSFDVGRTKKDAAAARQAAVKTEHSINNRPTSLSDRLDGLMDAVSKVQSTQREHGEKLTTHTRDLRGVRADIGGLQGADRALREDVASTNQQLSRHMRETSEWTPMLTELHTQYVGKERINKTEQ